MVTIKNILFLITSPVFALGFILQWIVLMFMMGWYFARAVFKHE